MLSNCKLKLRKGLLLTMGWPPEELSTNASSCAEWKNFLLWAYGCMSLCALEDFLGLSRRMITEDMDKLNIPRRAEVFRGRPIKPVTYQGRVYPGGAKEVASDFDISVRQAYAMLEDQPQS